MTSFSIKVIIADDHPAVLTGLLHALAPVSSIEVVSACRNSTELLAALNEHPCDVVISDYSMPDENFGDGISLFSYVQRRYPATRLIALTMISNPAIIQNLISHGISTVLSKSDEVGHIIAAVHASYAKGSYLSPTMEAIVNNGHGKSQDGEIPLSPREIEVVRLFTSGLSVNEIANRLKRSKQTISSQKANAMRKLGLNSDIDLLKYALKVKLVEDTTNH
ncbi:response regulator transcription factor [Burkholderia thailandensis]|uniref:DNA-binding response regulator n=1 Tax=Burkholderia thailandensis (strain ATCC 700388 / DSM 13276 / CCUG 48851 / CIP 106301 / E264) TaxID=271848 RepID=Q2T905_BURTA|nr:response regulator transcription factor [Burkholderia thailandensis]ABC35737.1 DNA-binding response regulator [Burkholderia thailandensis E264]AHI75422.1 bacterial regulatory s, luxR family protein [Burkholderia thailandensis 2002721723]AHI82413.1 bacterial regulatory s, luxR family protein [Burkholderia thailandensis E444]AIC91042.1 bacterial regulatory s, luxR family protein [Burkholderia thailandensis USAMRU Malaysia \